MQKLKVVLCTILVSTIFSFNAINGVSVMLGDINCDGYRNSTDLVELRKMLLGTADSLQTGDVNQDKCINIIDLVRLKKQVSLYDDIWISSECQGKDDIF